MQKARFFKSAFLEVSLFRFNKKTTKDANWKNLGFWHILFLGNRAKASENKFITDNVSLMSTNLHTNVEVVFAMFISSQNQL